MSKLRDIARMINEHNREKNLAEEFGLYLNEAIVRLYREEKTSRKPSKHYKPSSMGGCLRNIFFQVVGAEIDKDSNISVSEVGMVESGTDRHLRLQNAITQMAGLGYPVEWVDIEEYLKRNPVPGTYVTKKGRFESKLRNDVFNLSFLSDGLVKVKGVPAIVEIKTEAGFKFNMRYEPEEKHIIQVACYSLCLGIDNVIFIYENRDFCNKKYLFYEVTEEDKQGIIDIIENCNNYVRENVVPPKTENTRNCNYCLYKEVCKLH